MTDIHPGWYYLSIPYMEGIKLRVRSVQTVRFDKPMQPPLKWDAIFWTYTERKYLLRSVKFYSWTASASVYRLDKKTLTTKRYLIEHVERLTFHCFFYYKTFSVEKHQLSTQLLTSALSNFIYWSQLLLFVYGSCLFYENKYDWIFIENILL